MTGVRKANQASPGARPTGVGLGLRWDFLEEVVDAPLLPVAFFEVAPENYMRRGGYFPALLERVKQRYPLVSHGLTLSLGASAEPDPGYLDDLRAFVRHVASPWHSDHLCFSSAGPVVLHELLPLKLCEENVERVAARVQSVGAFLGVPMAVENISFYAYAGEPEMPEAEFIGRVVDRSGCRLLLDVNNVYVNSQNHGYDPRDFIAQLPLDRVIQIHVAGHTRMSDGLIIDTHGAPVIDPVFELLDFTLRRTGPVAVALERDNDVPPLAELIDEVRRLAAVYEAAVKAPAA
ncbi:MAG TPA: DUF692 domain-containing protein [Polyangiaceae bacterium]